MKKVRKGFALFHKRPELGQPGIPLCEPRGRDTAKAALNLL